MIPTPTLVPGLPTSTPHSLSGISVEDDRDGFSPTPRPSPTVAPPPTATPLPEQRLLLGQNELENEDFASAAEHFEAGLQSNELDPDEQQEALLGLGQAKLELGQSAAAADTLSELLAVTAIDAEISGPEEEESATVPDDTSRTEDAYFFLGQSYAEQGDCEGAIGAYEKYLDENPDLAAYIQPRIANCYQLLGDKEALIQAYAAAVEGSAERFTEVGLRMQLAQLYSEEGDYAEAVNQYDAILEVARTEATRGEVTYLAGAAELIAGNTEEGYARYMQAVMDYPLAYESYLALTALIEAEQSVDDFQRGLVDYHAGAYEPAIVAFSHYIEANPDHREDAHLYLAWSYEGLGDLESAIGHMDAFIEANEPTDTESNPEDQEETSENTDEDIGSASDENAEKAAAARGWLEKAKLLTRAGLTLDAVDSYLKYLEFYPDGEDAPLAAWWAAALTEELGETERAIDLYERLEEDYPWHEDAAEALFRAAYLTWLSGDKDGAKERWQRAASAYADRRFGAAAILWLLKEYEDGIVEDATEEEEVALNPRLFEDYFALRALHVVSESVPFQPIDQLDLVLSESEQEKTENWLRELLELEDDTDVRTLSEDLASDGRLKRANKLWHIGLMEEAKREIESLRLDHEDDALASYQLALFFRDLGLYRSSILAATSVMRLAEVDVFSAPRYLGTLAYPTYFIDLVTAEANNYDLDPLLLFSLIRQESLFESFARSSAAAQGLSQVIPETGTFIAQRLNWPDFVNEDLYKPYVGVAFGAYYLDQQLKAFDGDVAAALSAYNAGPGNAARWYGEAAGDIDQYHQIVDFSETRQYIERIYTGHAAYRFLYG